ncbi:hypothetical protein TNIN_115701 [Trichonephila inaurata madagascariensis]|uniref:Uncharacterized protein n=1 Tax=Trichonephila inaurata madagascariensis TaxID=2747483 RepID=A0A8X6X3I2_9ARAC|nr:hypothetical protein TNIN_115701 [Trichonephila inaurata madagascariensis]
MIIYCTRNNKILFSMAETETHFQKGRDKKENYEEKENKMLSTNSEKEKPDHLLRSKKYQSRWRHYAASTNPEAVANNNNKKIKILSLGN